ncbi:MAG TPA: YsnF/AvaK domain-containing protein [Isosphaeraceae bacterium]
MSRKAPGIVVGQEGLRGTIESTAQHRPGADPKVVVRLDDGLRLAVPAELLTEQGDGTYAVPIGPADIERLRLRAAQATEPAAVIPVVVEELEVHKRTVERGRVRITKRVHEREEVVDEPLLREEVEVERVPVNRLVDGPVAVRQEGDTTIVPLVEEILVVEKRLMLKEELRITKRRVQEHTPQRVTLRTEEATVERVGPQDRSGPVE